MYSVLPPFDDRTYVLASDYDAREAEYKAAWDVLFDERDALAAKLAAAEADRNAATRNHEIALRMRNEAFARAEAAEARVKRLEDALREIEAEWRPSRKDHIARAALAADAGEGGFSPPIP
jgi:RecA-family ATPase